MNHSIMNHERTMTETGYWQRKDKVRQAERKGTRYARECCPKVRHAQQVPGGMCRLKENWYVPEVYSTKRFI